MNTRTTQDLLAERRFNVNEMRFESDATAREMLQEHIADIDRELADRRNS